MSYHDPVDHRSMALDNVRNAYYEKALAATLTSESVVLDAGAGIGVLGLMAAKLGAKKVYLLEPATQLEAARQIAAANHLEDKVEFVDATVENALLPEKVDVITSVFTGNFLLEEDLLPSLFLAREKFLKPDGVMIPNQGRMMLAPVSMPEFYRDEIDIWTKDSMIDHSVMRTYAVNRLYYDNYRERTFELLSDPRVLKTLDFTSAQKASCSEQATFEVKEGVLHGFLGWFDIDFGHDWLSTSPDSEKTHWSQVFLPLNEPLPIEQSESVSIHIDRPEYGEWTWRVETRETTYRQSTFLGVPMTPKNLRLAAAETKAALNVDGQVQAFVLNAMNEEVSSSEIADLVVAKFPDKFSNPEAALRFVISLVRTFGR